MLRITLKNLLKSKLLTLCLIAGFILSTAVVSAIPMYTKSLLKQFLDDTFAKASVNSTLNKPDQAYIYPGMLSMSVHFLNIMVPEQYSSQFNSSKRDFGSMCKGVPVPVLTQKSILSVNKIKYKYRKDGQEYISAYNEIDAISDFDKHINIVNGSLPGDALAKDNVVEAVVDTKTFNDFALEINKSYEITSVSSEIPLKIKVVGIYEPKSQDDPYWLDRDTNFYCRFMVTQNAFFKMMVQNPGYSLFMQLCNFKALYDYNKIDSTTAINVYNTASRILTASRNRTGQAVVCTLVDNLKPYVEKESLYTTVMWMFLIPVLLLVMYYVFMVSGFIVNTDKDQIALLKSRGASRYEILKIYLYEGVAISAIGLIAGPPLGFLLCRLITYTDGFMKFSTNNSSRILFSSDVYLYAAAIILLMLSTLLISVYFASRKSIVEVKQGRNKRITAIFKFRNIDFVLLAVSVYGYYLYGNNKNMSAITGASRNGAPIDPLLYLVSTLFIIGAGMFLLRIYKLIIRGLLIPAKKINVPSLYLSIVNVLRDHLKKNTAMLFVVITVALGIYNINIAKNINTSYENTTKYMSGADLIIKGVWDKYSDSSVSEVDGSKLYHYVEETPYSDYSKVEGIESYTKVLNTPNGRVALSKGAANVSANLLGIVPDEFGKIAWFDSSLLKYHWYNYLNMLTQNKDYVLISKGLSESSSIKKGDYIYYKIGNGLSMRAVVGEIVDYWPGFDNLQSRNLIIANFDYIFSHIQKYPYQIWIKKAPGISDKYIYDSMKSFDMGITEFSSMSYNLYTAKNELFLKGTNAVLTLCFLSIAVITIIGFIIYWIISLKSRVLQFGIYRSLGLSSSGVSKLLILEQVLTLGSSILLGSILGVLTGQMFMPIIKGLWYYNKYAIPVKNINYNNEYLQLGVIIALIFVFSLFVLKRYISSLKIHQAVKLGED